VDLGLTDLYHAGIVVADIDEAISRYTDHLGIGPWSRLDAEIPCLFRGEETISGARVALARSGTSYVELVQPTSGRSSASAFLQERGEGLYHLGFWVPDVDATVARAAEHGIGVDWSASDGKGLLFAYLDAAKMGGVHIELVPVRLRAFIEGVVASGGDSPS
jgi:methylmalonyl-CoA/ethylmalonyl-CoA epimerase